VRRIVPRHVFVCADCLIPPDYPDPVKEYALSQNDRNMLRVNKILAEV